MLRPFSNLTEPQTDRLMLADPKAIKHILHSTGYRYTKAIESTHMSKIVSGNGLVSAQGLNIIWRSSIELICTTLQARLITVSGRL